MTISGLPSNLQPQRTVPIPSAPPKGDPQSGPVTQESASELQSQSFIRVMMLAEEMATLTASARDAGDAVQAVKYSSFEQNLLQVAAGLQIAIDLEKVEK
ncbi:hypothetical protein MB46_10295 [Arthrobacter alpinus]|uniref:hypothetical protein n=1 Tax=Arthrobacter alpinus TaxID=656366 RepID=UPI0005C7F58C|nr:hypothetical protein [Arthrobacter alpinus]ALV45810.1 hypothetical protein MB46_10295 [Arthrobacter alpinus]